MEFASLAIFKYSTTLHGHTMVLARKSQVLEMLMR